MLKRAASWRAAGAGPRPVDRTRSVDARCLLHNRRRCAAAMDQSFAGARLRRRRASAIRPRESGRFSCENQHPQYQQGQRIVQRHGGPVASRRGHGHRREIIGARRTNARSRHPLSQAVLRFATERLLRWQTHHRRNHAPGRRDAERPHRRHVHQSRPHRTQLQHGRIRIALSGSHGASRAGRCGACPQAASRAPGIRSQHSAVRSCRSQPTRHVRRRAHTHNRRLVRCSGWEHNRQSDCTRAEQLPGSAPMNPPMNTSSSAVPDSTLQSQAAVAPAHIPAARRLYWSIRRELWEYRSIYVAPLAAAAVFLFGFLIALPHHMHGVKTLDQARAVLDTPYELAAGLIMGTAFIVGIFYSLDALYGERRDRSILFWKSLPVSDLTTVLSKLTIPLIILPLLSFAIAVATQFVMLLLSSVALLGSGQNIGALWARMSFFHMSLMLLYHIATVHGLWYAPLYGWLLLISAWAPRAPFIWAFLPPFVIWGLEKIAFNTSHFLAMLQHRLTGPEPSSTVAPHGTVMEIISALTLAQFLSTPGLWIGLAIAAAFLFVAVRLRRYRGPISFASILMHFV